MSNALLRKIDLTAFIAAGYPVTPQYECEFQPTSYWLRNDSADMSEIMVSFDGQNDNLSLHLGIGSAYTIGSSMADDVTWPCHTRKVWFRVVPPGPPSGAPVVAIMAHDVAP